LLVLASKAASLKRIKSLKIKTKKDALKEKKKPKSKSSTKNKKKPLPPFDKYEYYIKSVQTPDVEAEFMSRIYQELNKKKAKTMREDFCGTFATCVEWVKQGPKQEAYGVDIDAEPIAYGKEHYLAELNAEQKQRVITLQKSVLDDGLPQVDIVCALNFSYFCFKKRALIKQYFQNVYDTLQAKGLLVLDCFGGSKCYESNLEITEHKGYEYHWDQEEFNPINQNAKFSIHFKRKGERKRKQVFHYDWRMWSIPELRDILEEVGFKKTLVYWEGSDSKGEGNGVFSASEQGEECESWVAYVVASK
jgi:hypothetical protein